MLCVVSLCRTRHAASCACRVPRTEARLHMTVNLRYQASDDTSVGVGFKETVGCWHYATQDLSVAPMASRSWTRPITRKGEEINRCARTNDAAARIRKPHHNAVLVCLDNRTTSTLVFIIECWLSRCYSSVFVTNLSICFHRVRHTVCDQL